jgi:hypothetical protein
MAANPPAFWLSGRGTNVVLVPRCFEGSFSMLMGCLARLEVRHDPLKNLGIAAEPQRNTVARASTVAMCP